ncbi:MAG: chorismate lyase [Proteobacteria bacterium]|nr:chorismate lyase [Pseudomonadota bacterium]
MKNATKPVFSRWYPKGVLDSLIPPLLKPLLLYAGSMTHHMESICHSVKIDAHIEHHGFACRDERQLLDLPYRQMVWVREITMVCDGEPWLFGRTVIPQKTLVGYWKRLTRLRSIPLGAVLFRDPNIVRGEYEIAQLDKHHFLYNKSRRYLENDKDYLWARRSQFYLDENPLLLSEVFLPAMIKRIMK